MKSAPYLNFSVKLIIILALLFLISQAKSQAATSPDAVAFRVIPNPEYLSPLRWYRENIKVKGSPQSLTVDGYQAVRDGRTVYVNAANVDPANPNFYTNIYIISYNQEAEDSTIDIFGQILKKWVFNSNISGSVCSFDNEKCSSSTKDCKDAGDCVSVKGQIVRDTKRLADLADIKSALKNYQAEHSGTYPELAAGSYLTGKSISVWPSWRATLGAALGITIPIDPLNKLGACTTPTGFNPVTCWNQATKTFADPPPPDEFNLPANSHAYVYTIDAQGRYDLCALMESEYTIDLDGACPDSGKGYEGEGGAALPTINCGTIVAAQLAPFSGFISLSGTYADRYDWTIEPVTPTSWDTWEDQGWGWDNGSSMLKISSFINTGNFVTKQLTAQLTPDSGKGPYSYKVRVRYGEKTVEETCNITINCVPQCPAASDVNAGYTYKGSDGCCGSCWVEGTKCVVDPSSWEPLSSTKCPNETVTQTSNCGTTQNVSGTKCCSKPGCSSSQPAYPTAAVTGSTCPAGETCYQCAEGYSWHSATLKCVKCGDGVVEGDEQCDTNSGDCTDINSGYKGTRTCNSNCRWNDCVTTEYCGDGIINGNPGLEKCDETSSRVCYGQGGAALPNYCVAGSLVAGTQNCIHCKWGDCSLNPPIENTSTTCDSSNVAITSPCCELVKCTQDGCGCCGHTTTPAEVTDGYETVTDLAGEKMEKTAVWDPARRITFYYNNNTPNDPSDDKFCPGGYYDNTNNIYKPAPPNEIPYLCTSCDDKYSICPDCWGENNYTCKLNRIPNTNNWEITTNHSAAYYRCWQGIPQP